MALTSKPDFDALATVSPRAVVGYLQNHGWTLRAPYGEHGAFFVREFEGIEKEILIPNNPRARDFAYVMSILVGDLADIEGRSPFDVMSDLTTAHYDVISIRSPDADEIGSLPLSVGVELHEQAQTIVGVAATAAAAEQHRVYWRGRQSGKVESYLNALRLGQSKRGSFVLSLLSPWDFEPAAVVQASLLEETPFGRKVTRELARGFAATQKAVSDAVSSGIESFSRAGLSVNWCDALATLAREGDGVDLSLSWSLTKPEDAASPLNLRRSDAQTLTEAKEFLKRARPIPDTVLQGWIIGITNRLESFDGSVVLLTPIDHSLKKVRVSFHEEDRRAVFDAGQDKLWVSVVGDLVTRPNGRVELLNPRDFTIVRPEDEDEGDEEA